MRKAPFSVDWGSKRRVAGVIGCTLGLVQFVSCNSDSPAGPSVAITNVRVNQSNEFVFQEEPSIAIDSKGVLFVGWKDMNAPQSGSRAAFATSVDGGLTWSTPRHIERLNAARGQSDPWLLVAPSGTLIYAQTHAGEITLVTSTNAGVTWTAPVNVNDRAASADKESMASDGASTVYLSYVSIEDSAMCIVGTRSRDGGLSWTPTTIIARSPGQYYQAPSLAALPDGRVYAAWWSVSDGNLNVAASQDFGTTWGAIRRVNPIVGSLSGDMRGPSTYTLFPPFPSLAVSAGGAVYVAWTDHATGDWDILVSRSDDAGATWSAPVQITDETVGNQWMVSLATDARGVLHAAWYDSRTGDTDVRYATSSDRAATWSTSRRVTTKPMPGAFNRLGDYLGLVVAPDGTAHLAWTDARGPDMDIYYATVPPAEH